MKYRYLIINEDGSIEGTQSIDNESLKEEFEEGLIDIIDCEHGEQLTSMQYQEWQYIKERKNNG